MAHLLTFVILIFSFPFTLQSGAEKKPNIVIIIADDLGWDDVGFHGSFQARTPNMNYLAENGQILMDYYVLPVCTPTRSALLTGKYPIKNGMQSSVILTAHSWGMGKKQTVLPKLLKKQGYKTHLVGKWHLGFFEEGYIPEKRGFDSFFGMYAGRGDYWEHTCNEGEFKGMDLRDGKEPVRSGTGNYSTDLLTDVAAQLISFHNKEKPLFLMLSYLAIHSANAEQPLQAKADDMQHFDTVLNKDRKTVLGMTTALDRGVGKVYEALKKKGILDNTVILFTTDNGAAANGFDSNYGSNFPLRGMKTTLFEGGVRATGFVHSKLLKSRPGHHEALLHVTDWLPSFYKLAGGDPETVPDLDGVDQWESLSEGKPSKRKEILLNIDEEVYNNEAIRIGDWKYIKQADDELDQWFLPPGYDFDQYERRYKTSNTTGGKVQCTKPPTSPMGCENGCLFNIRDDPCEHTNVALSTPKKLKELTDRLEFHRKKMIKARFNGTVDPRCDPKKFNDVWSPWLENGHAINVTSVDDKQSGDMIEDDENEANASNNEDEATADTERGSENTETDDWLAEDDTSEPNLRDEESDQANENEDDKIRGDEEFVFSTDLMSLFQ